MPQEVVYAECKSFPKNETLEDKKNFLFKKNKTKQKKQHLTKYL